MKRELIAIMIAASLAASAPVAAYAAEGQTEAAESSGTQILAQVNAADGACALFGGTAYDGNLYLWMAYQNNGNSNNYPATAFNVQAFQDGVALKMAFTLNKPKGFESSTTLVQPGTTIAFYEVYQLRNESPVEVQISPLLDFANSNIASYTFEFSELADVNTSEAQTEVSENWEEKYNELLQQYELLEEKYNALLEAQNKAE